MRPIYLGLAAAVTVTLGGCVSKLEITNPNTPSEATAALVPRTASIRLIVGVLATYRGNRGGQINAFGSYGRETYNMTPQDGRSVTGPFRDWKQNNAFTAGSEWGSRYGNYRNVYATIKLMTPVPEEVISTAEKQGGLGVMNTFLALDLLHMIEARGDIGGVVDMTDDPNAVLPFVSRDSVYKWITAKLDEANTQLAAAGTSFFFPMHTGFSAFGVSATTPAGFIKFNRAIKARVEVKRGSLGCGATCYNAALTALGASFIADLTAANRDQGIYVVYSTATGDVLNSISFATNSNLYVHPLIDGIAGVAQDDRYKRKTCTASSRTLVSVTATRRPCTYAANVTSIPIVRNEELVLLRAEAKWNTGDQAGARADLALVRAQSGATNGGTAAVKFANPATNAEFVDELLLQRTLSLFQEGHRWPDYIRFGKLAELGTLAQDIAAGFTVAPYSVLPTQECDSRARAGAAAERTCPGGAP
jgi:starch-binding outer membrane protein, SusD/RagB family